MPSSKETGDLGRLAALYGVQTRYRDSQGREQASPDQAVRAVLAALGADLGGPRGLEAALEARTRELWERMLEPVLVAWEGRLPPLMLRLPVDDRAVPAGAGGTGATVGVARGVAGGARVSRGRTAGAVVRFSLTLETGEVTDWEVPAHDLVFVDAWSGGGRAVVAQRAPAGAAGRALRPWSGRLPLGRHRLQVECGRSTAEATVLSAPRRCWAAEADDWEARADGSREDDLWGASAGGALQAPETDAGCLGVLSGRPWGVFCPVYALRSRRDWGAGDLADFAALGEWTAARGGSCLATLPLLATVPSDPYDPSPYRPSSRLFWNEFFLAVDRVPEWERCPEARALWESEAVQVEAERLRALSYVDYQAVGTLKRRVLELLAACSREQTGAAADEGLARYLGEHPWAHEFAGFCEGGRHVDYHLYCQWRMEEQMAELARSLPGGLMLDLPLGVHPEGFDVSRWPGLFVQDVSAGAPPDRFFTRGQVWDSPPLHPEADRMQGYRYLSAALAQQMRHARYLRIDHMMSFHRLFWVPRGMEAADGVYVAYRAEEAYAVLALESHRHRTEVFGEDLGTVPPGVRADMARHAVGRTWVFQTSLRPGGSVHPVPRGSVATLGTHDMFPVAGFLRGDDVSLRERMGLLGSEAARHEAAARRRLVGRVAKALRVSQAAEGGGEDGLLRSILRGALAWMAASPARLVLVNLEDLWLETRPQNVPGTGVERPNWRGKAGVAIEELDRADRPKAVARHVGTPPSGRDALDETA